MKKYLCETCGYIYDPEVGDPDNGVEPGTAFEDIPEDWLCPLCGLGKDAFVETEQYKNCSVSNQSTEQFFNLYFPV